MADLLTDACETLEDISSRRPGRTHYDGCRTEHVDCLIADLIEEMERLRLTDAEREAIRLAADAYDLDSGDAECEAIAATLRGLLERLGY